MPMRSRRARQGRCSQKIIGSILYKVDTPHEKFFDAHILCALAGLKTLSLMLTMRTSFETQSVSCQFPVSQIPVQQLYTRLSCCTPSDHDAPFQRDTCERFMCKGSDRHQRLFSFSLILWFSSRLRDSGFFWNLFLRQVILALIRIPHVVSPCEKHLIAHTCSIRLRLDFRWWDWQTEVEGGGTRVLWSGRAIGIQGYETEEENPQTLTDDSEKMATNVHPRTVWQEFKVLLTIHVWCFFFFQHTRVSKPLHAQNPEGQRL